MNDQRITDDQQEYAGAPAGAGAKRAPGFDLFDILILLAKRKKLVIGLPVAAAIVGAAYSLAVPVIYQASAKMLPPQQSQSGAAALLSQLGGIAGAAAGAAGLKSPNDLYIGMLKSRTVADHLIARFKLQQVYDVDTLEKARRTLEGKTVITAGKDGLITIEVEDVDKERSARLANAYIEELNKLTKVIAVTEAGQRRVFYEAQFTRAKDNLAAAEMALKGALDTHGVISVDTESRAIVETVARLRAQISAQEIQLNSMRAFVTTSNPEFLRAQENLASLRGELAKLENGRSGTTPVADGTKQVGLENIKMLRDVKYYQMLYEILAKQYEIARLDEAKDAALIQVLDPAVVPEQKYKPKRTLIVLLSGLAGLLVAVTWAFVADAKERASAFRAAQWAELKSYLRK